MSKHGEIATDAVPDNGRSHMKKECKDEFASVYNRLWAALFAMLLILAGAVWYTWHNGKEAGASNQESKAEIGKVAAQAKLELTQVQGVISTQLQDLQSNQTNMIRDIDRVNKNVDRLLDMHMKDSPAPTKP